MDLLAGVGVIDDRSHRNFEDDAFAIASGLVGTLAVASALGLVFWIEAKVHERVVAFAGFHHHVATAASISAGGPTPRHELLPPEGKTAVAAVPGFHANCGFIDEQ